MDSGTGPDSHASSVAMAQDALPEAPGAEAAPAASSADAEAPAAEAAPASGLDPALYTPMKPVEGVGMPVDGGLDFQPQVSETGKQAKWINNCHLVADHDFLSVCSYCSHCSSWVMVRFRRGANPEPSKTTHNTFIEIVWTVIPVIILLVIAVPSISLLAKQFEPAPEDALTVKVTGYQWYWGYSYPDNGDFEVISNMLPEEEANERAASRFSWLSITVWSFRSGNR